MILVRTLVYGVATAYLVAICNVQAFSSQADRLILKRRRLGSMHMVSKGNDVKGDRRSFLSNILSTSTAAAFLQVPDSANAVERAVGSAEKSCREEGNCLEKGDWDGAVGWNWGGKDRCDATDPRCGSDGLLREFPLSGQPIPEAVGREGLPLKVTNVVNIDIVIGKSEKGTLSIGLYGEACPSSVAQMMDFLSDGKKGGILTTSKLMLEDGYGVVSTPVSLGKGGVLNTIYPQNRIDFGVPSQGIAYAKAMRLNKAGDDFIAQPRPSESVNENIAKEQSPRDQSVAGLITIPKKGLGYGGNTLSADDEAFASAFGITTASISSNKEGRRVIGQIMNEQSMELLARLSSLPVRKGLTGVIPGQNSGPPLLKVTVLSTSLSNDSEMI